MTDREVSNDDLDRCRRGDIAGLEAIYLAFGDRVYRLCRSILGDDHAAEDVAQEVFLRVFAKLSKFEAKSSLSTWIYRLAVNHCLNSRKRWLRWPQTLDRLDGGAGEYADAGRDGRRAAAQLEAKDEVDRLLAPLSKDHRAVLVLREILGLEYREIGEVLDIPDGTVMSRLGRARAAVVARATSVASETPVAKLARAGARSR